MGPVLTVGVEEEFLLVDADGRPLPVAPQVLAHPAAAGCKAELMTFQLETASSVHTDLASLRAELLALRRGAAAAAGDSGALLLATGTSPFGLPEALPLSDVPRYRELARRFPGAMPAAASCGCHVHVGVPDRDAGARVLGRLAPWLPVLLALAANSPFGDGTDSGWASSRFRLQLTWPSFRPPRRWRDGVSYDASVRSLIRTGRVLDERAVYFLARLSPRYPTVEVRVADVCLDVEDAVLLAALVRALVLTTLRSPPGPEARPGRERARLLSAARLGVLPEGHDVSRPDWLGELRRLRAAVLPALEETGDADAVGRAVDRLALTGGGAHRQRGVWGPQPRLVVDALATLTLAGAAPVPGVVRLPATPVPTS
ncbi:MAG TPA: YbdK family carboxylate-amine ligase [Motilibacteraceae bacterium]|nr:YbdK family carboxylate-amine ligase [Motilibacteraceae bacterium]